jgi:hypothetical protein
MKYAVGIDLEKIKPYMAGYALDRFLLIDADNKEEAVQEYLDDENIKGWIREGEKKLVAVQKEFKKENVEVSPTYEFNVYINKMRNKYEEEN